MDWMKKHCMFSILKQSKEYSNVLETFISQVNMSLVSFCKKGTSYHASSILGQQWDVLELSI